MQKPSFTGKPSLRRLFPAELLTQMQKYDTQPYRARQLYPLLFKTHLRGFEQYPGLPKSLVETLQQDYAFTALTIERRIASEKDITTKYLHQTQQGEQVESVIIRKEDRVTACLSSQVGCKFACRFCVSGSQGLFRNLDASEIVDQYFLMQQEEGERITNLVMMGMGEPFDNYQEVIRAIEIINSKEGFDLGARHITLSTVGVPEGIARFAKEGLSQIKLAWSLHAATDEVREKLMPVNKKWNIAAVRDALVENREAFKRRITFEYILFDNLNDTPEQAKALAALAREVKAKVNLIRYNPTGFGINGLAFKASSLDRMRAFREILDKQGIINTLRKSGGSDVGAACGQLSLAHK